jgi:hypothetical protein
MKYIFYVILLFIIVICLFYSPKKENYFDGIDKKPNIIDDKTLEIEESTKTNNSITVRWKSPGNPVSPPKPNEDTSIKGYIIMLKKTALGLEKAVYMKFYIDSEAQNCNNCEYTLTGLSLESDTNYTIQVMPFNNFGSGPIASRTFQSVPSPSSSPSPPTSSPTQSQPNTLDEYVNNMVLRADGLYDWDNTPFKYPDTYNYDVKQSLNVLNDQLKKDLQSYRINVHLGATQR